MLRELLLPLRESMARHHCQYYPWWCDMLTQAQEKKKKKNSDGNKCSEILLSSANFAVMKEIVNG